MSPDRSAGRSERQTDRRSVCRIRVLTPAVEEGRLPLAGLHLVTGLRLLLTGLGLMTALRLLRTGLGLADGLRFPLTDLDVTGVSDTWMRRRMDVSPDKSGGRSEAFRSRAPSVT